MNRYRLLLTIIFLPAIVPTAAAALAIILFVLAVVFVVKTAYTWADWVLEWLTSRAL